MKTIEFVLDYASRTNMVCESDIKRLLNEMYARYLEDMHRTAGLDGFLDFLLYANTRYFWKEGAIVSPKKGAELEKDFGIGVVNDYTSTYDQVYVHIKGSSSISASAGDLEKADVPDDLLDILKDQMKDRCPLKEASCLEGEAK